VVHRPAGGLPDAKSQAYNRGAGPNARRIRRTPRILDDLLKGDSQWFVGNGRRLADANVELLPEAG
jgi:hypothetical protein